MNEEHWNMILFGVTFLSTLALCGVAIFVSNEIAWRKHLKEMRKLYGVDDRR